MNGPAVAWKGKGQLPFEDWGPGGARVVHERTGRAGMISPGFPHPVCTDRAVWVSDRRQCLFWVCAVATQM